MSVYFITGHLGGGKGVQSVGRLIAYAEQGRRIAGNVEINLEKLCQNPRSKQSYIRLPDIPTSDDLHALGLGSETRAEDTFGALVLDECAVFLNSRDWQEKGRRSIMAWLVHARKFRWDVFIQIQDVDALDSQIRKLLHEYTVDCLRLDKLSIPIVTRLTGLRPPKFFVARVFYGRMNPPVRADTWYTSGKRAFDAYDTEQVIMDESDDGTYCMLPEWHRVGRYMPPPKTFMEKCYAGLSEAFGLFLRALMVIPYILVVRKQKGLGAFHAKARPDRFQPARVMPMNLSLFIRHSHDISRRSYLRIFQQKGF